jgi:signal transduction histidine kinase
MSMFTVIRTSNTVVRLALAWTPFFLLWVLFTMAFMEIDVGEAVLSGLVSTGTAAVLALPVWRFTGRLQWPDRIAPGFVLAHLAAGFPYALAWTVAGYAVFAVEMQASIIELIRNSGIFGWRLLMGYWLYAIVAGVSYAVRTRHRLREQERVAARAEALALKARLATLRGQLNPHFLFNALNSVTTLIRHDPARAEEAVGRLADLLRYSLDEGTQTAVSMEDEWQFTRGYLEMQQLRFGDRLRFQMDATPGALACSVPPFVLQPLVENAVEHAVSPRTEGGTVHISADLTATQLVLTIEDDGPGITPSEDRSGHGHGLTTLRARVAATYGDAGSLKINRSGLGGVCARLALPVHVFEIQAMVDKPSGTEVS